MITSERRHRAPVLRLRTEQWYADHAELARHPVFTYCSRAELRRIYQRGDLVEVAASKQLLAEDRIGYWFFVVCKGSVRLTRGGRHHSTVGAGGTVGHDAIIGMGPQMATVITEVPSRLFILSRRELINVFYTMRSVRQALLPGVAEDDVRTRVREMHAQGREAWSKVPVNTARLPLLARRVETVERPWQAPSMRTRVLRSPSPSSTRSTLPRVSPRARLVIGVVLLAGFLVGAVSYRLPVAVVTAGRPFDALDDIRVRGVPAYRPKGRYLVLSVTVERPTLVGLARGINRHRQLIATNRVSRTDVAEQRALFRNSQLVAAAVAARRAGLPVAVRGTGAVVTEIPPHSSAAGVLAPDDVIVSDNGRRVGTSLDLMNGNEHVLVVERGAENVTVTVHGAVTDLATRTRQLRVELPFSVQFRKRSLGGPSAGLAYALAVADLLDRPDHTGGRAIAATGELAVDGALASVGGLPWKAQGARSEHAAVLLAPASELALVPKSALTVRGVWRFEDAFAAL